MKNMLLGLLKFTVILFATSIVLCIIIPFSASGVAGLVRASAFFLALLSFTVTLVLIVVASMTNQKRGTHETN